MHIVSGNNLGISCVMQITAVATVAVICLACDRGSGPEPGTIVDPYCALFFDPCECPIDDIPGEWRKPITIADLTIKSQTDLDNAKGIQSVQGNLFVCGLGSEVTDLAGLVDLQMVAGAVVIGRNTGLSSVLGPDSLTSVGGSVIVFSNNALSEIVLPGLLTVGGEVLIVRSPALATIRLSALESVQASVEIADTTGTVSAVDLPTLHTAGGIHVYDTGISELVLPMLSAVGGWSLLVSGNDQLWSIEAPLLGSAEGGVGLAFNQMLTASKFPSLSVIGTLSVAGNNMLASLGGLGALSAVAEDFIVVDNPSLPTCEATALRDRLLAAGGIGGNVDISGNNDAGTCN